MSDTPKRNIISVVGADERSAREIATLLDEGNGTRQLRILLMGIVFLVLAFLIWSALAEVDELAKARGEIKPVSRVQLVQSMEGGILAELLVHEDDFVEKGDVIARFAATDVQKEQLQAQIRRVSYQIDLERWGALADGREPDFSSFTQYPKLVAEARSLYQRQAGVNVADVRAKYSELDQQKAALQGIQNQLPVVQQEADAAADVYDRYQRGRERDLVSAVQLANAKQSAASARRELVAMRSRYQELKTAVATAEAQLDSASQSLAQQAGAKRSELLEAIAELDAEVEALDARHGRTALMAPVSGFIKSLPDTRNGAVIPAGGTVAEIVPTDEGVVMEVNVSPRDIGFVKKGQIAMVKIDAFDYSRFGSIEGTVTRISPTAIHSERQQEPHYRVELELSQEFVGSDDRHRLIPGMTGEADIATGHKTVFQYIVKPVFITADTAFHER